jgi:hypothetical protein
MPTELEKRLEAARQKARLAIEGPAKSKRSLKTQLILGLCDDIAVMRSKDWTWAQIADEFQDTIGASSETIRQVIAEHAKNRKKPGSPARKKAEQAKPPPLIPPARTTPRSIVSASPASTSDDLSNQFDQREL